MPRLNRSEAVSPETGLLLDGRYPDEDRRWRAARVKHGLVAVRLVRLSICHSRRMHP